jgi:hypothetical protein
MSEKQTGLNQNTLPERIAELLNDTAVKPILKDHLKEYIDSGLMSCYIEGIKDKALTEDIESTKADVPLLVTHTIDKDNIGGEVSWFGLEEYSPSTGQNIQGSEFIICGLNDIHRAIEYPSFYDSPDLLDYYKILNRHYDEQVQAGIDLTKQG